MEDAGWEIRDCVMWIYGSGFPKSHELGAKIDKAKGLIEHRGKMVKHQRGQENYDKPEGVGKHEPISPEAKEWSGWGENLKPAYEPIIMARKPFKGSLTNNVLTNKTGALNIDACRVGTEVMPARETKTETTGIGWEKHGYTTPEATGRFPANVIISHNEGCVKVGEQTETLNNSYASSSGIYEGGWSKGRHPANVILSHNEGCVKVDETTETIIGGNKGKSGFVNGYESGDFTKKEISVELYECEDGCSVKLLDEQVEKVSRFFYCPKVSSKERNFGCEELPERQTIGGGGTETNIAGAYGSVKAKSGNHHPTLKPIELMKWLVKLVSKEGQIILDPFTGSGSTGIATELLGREFIGIEMDADYCEIAEKRINAWKEKENKSIDEDKES